MTAVVTEASRVPTVTRIRVRRKDGTCLTSATLHDGELHRVWMRPKRSRAWTVEDVQAVAVLATLLGPKAGSVLVYAHPFEVETVNG